MRDVEDSIPTRVFNPPGTGREVEDEHGAYPFGVQGLRLWAAHSDMSGLVPQLGTGDPGRTDDQCSPR